MSRARPRRSSRSASVAVTGGCGYIGSGLVPMLQEADDVGDVALLDNLGNDSPRNLVNCDLGAGNLSFTQGDVRDYGAVENALRDADTIHLAAITGATVTHDREAETRVINLEGTENLLKAAQKFDVERYVFASPCIRIWARGAPGARRVRRTRSHQPLRRDEVRG